MRVGSVAVPALLDARELLVVERHRAHPEPPPRGVGNAPATRRVDQHVARDAEQPRDLRAALGVVVAAVLERAGEGLGDDVEGVCDESDACS
jgi:hypothetical protein